MFRFFCIFSIILFLPLLVAAQQSDEPCSNKIVYENHNQVDYEIILSNDIEGTAVDSSGNLLADVCIALFTEKSHRFVAQTMTDEDGHFKFGKTPKGKYRLVGNLYSNLFCTANAQIRRVKKKSSKSSENKLVLHLQVQGIDSCSYFDTK